MRPANTTSTCHNYFAAKEQAGWEIQFVWAIVRCALTHALAHVLISTCNFTNCNMPAMKVQKQTQKVVSACLLKFVLVHVCVCLGHACNLKRRLFEEAAQRWKHGCSMVFQSLLAT
jgi:hypothetical protein